MYATTSTKKTQARVAALNDEINNLQKKLGMDQDAEAIVKTHIKLLHQYNEAKDATQPWSVALHLPMLSRYSSVVLRDGSSSGQSRSALNISLATDEASLLEGIIEGSRPGASAYLLKIKGHLKQPRQFLEVLRSVQDLESKRINPPTFIRNLVEKLQGLHSLPELISGSIEIMPSGCILQVQRPKSSSFVVTIRYPADSIPEHVVCRRGPRELPDGFFGHPGPTPNNSPQRVDDSKRRSLKRKRSNEIKRGAAVVFGDDGLMPPPRMETRQSKRLRLQKEKDNSMQMDQSSSAPKPVRDQLTVAAVIALFTGMLSDRVKRRRLMAFKEEKAQMVLDTMQALIDVPDLIPASKTKLKQGVIKLSAESALPPTCFSLCGLNIDDFSPSDAADGNFGEIYSGVFHRQRLCIKVVKLRQKSYMDKAVKAFLKEGVTWGQINHPNVLPFYGIYRLQDKYNRLSLVSPWLENGNVNAFLENNQTANRLLLVYDIIQGIAHLHKEGIVHGDLKGPNILVTLSGRACIADFGLATMTYEKKTKLDITAQLEHDRWHSSLASTRAVRVGALRADNKCRYLRFWLHHIFTGQLPFYEFSQPVRVLKIILDGKRPTKPSFVHPAWKQWGLSEEIWGLMEDCWEADPEKRPLANKVVKLIPRMGKDGRLEDTRVTDGDEYLSPSAFRHAVHAKLKPLSEETVEKVVEWLREEDAQTSLVRNTPSTMPEPPLPPLLLSQSLATMFLAGLCLGIYLVSFGFANRWLLFTDEGWKFRKKPRWVMVAMTNLIAVLTITAAGLTVHISRFQTLIDEDGHMLTLLVPPPWNSILKCTLLNITALLVNTILVQETNSIPIFLWLGAVVCLCLQVYLEIVHINNPDFGPYKWAEVNMELGPGIVLVPFWASTITMNVFCTGILVRQVWKALRATHFNTSSRPLQFMLRILAESGILYLPISLAHLVVWFGENNFAIQMIGATNATIVGTAYNLIVIRVAQFRAEEEGMNTFAPNLTAVVFTSQSTTTSAGHESKAESRELIV
ncbi:hypothetical protein NP233_g11083 [Leucocoprinus birnbaumii]|uniref:Protein kinase domain-containing protein n=1 Tax=Leucocoprinus birnbaumii TaxID=56174 RepID=A0AAD5VI19_9AGAR|nr:hypothetical protein NP233_g11083 [Leucocoprinus birnbaumii]